MRTNALERFRFGLEDSLRNAPHTLGDEAEETLAYFSQAFGSPNTIYSMVANSDIPWPTVTLSNGEEGTIDSQGYSRFRSSDNREDRKLVFDTFLEQMAGVSKQRRRGSEFTYTNPDGPGQSTQLRFCPASGTVSGQPSREPSIAPWSLRSTRRCRRCIATSNCAPGCLASTRCTTTTSIRLSYRSTRIRY